MSSYPPQAPLNRPIRLGVLISGGGTTLQNFIDRITAGELNAEIAIVIASRPDCSGLQKAEQAGLKTAVISRRDFSDVESFSTALFDLLRREQVDLVTLAGFLCLIRIPSDFTYRVMNIHPALVPAFSGRGFYGRNVHAAALQRGVKISGCTVHFADNEYDHGPIILQRVVPVRDDDTPETLAARVFTAECEAYPEAVRLFAEGRLQVQGQQVFIRND